MTDNEGVAVFSNVELGQHRVLIAYKGFQREQTVTPAGEVTEYTVKPQAVFLAPQVLIAVGILSGLLLVLVVLLIRAKRR